MAIHEDSRNFLTEVVTLLDGATERQVQPSFLDSRPRVAAFASDDRTVLPDDSLSWSHLGVRYLDNANAWWVIADLSGVVDPFDELHDGRKLRVPSIGRYRLDILPGERGASGRRSA